MRQVRNFPDFLNNAQLTANALSSDVQPCWLLIPFTLPIEHISWSFIRKTGTNNSKILGQISPIAFHVKFLHCDYSEPWASIFKLILGTNTNNKTRKTNHNFWKQTRTIPNTPVLFVTVLLLQKPSQYAKQQASKMTGWNYFAKQHIKSTWTPPKTSVNNQQDRFSELTSNYRAPYSKLNLLMNVPTTSKRWIYCIGWIRTMLFILFLQNTQEKNPRLIDSIERRHFWLSNFFIYRGHSGSLLIRSPSSPVLLTLGTFLPNLVFRNFPGKSKNLARCIIVIKLELETLPSRFWRNARRFSKAFNVKYIDPVSLSAFFEAFPKGWWWKMSGGNRNSY